MKEIGCCLLWLGIMAKVPRDSSRQLPWAPQGFLEKKEGRGLGMKEDEVMQEAEFRLGWSNFMLEGPEAKSVVFLK